MSAEQPEQIKQGVTPESNPFRRKIAAELLAVAALFSVVSPGTAHSAELPEPTPTATATPLEINPTPAEPTPTQLPELTPSLTPEVPQTEIVTTNTPLRIRTANVTGKHMDGHKGNGYSGRPYYATYDERKVGLIKDITGIKVDAMGLQEVDAGTQSNYIRSGLGKRGYETLPTWTRNINPIYWDKNKFDPVKGSTFALGDRDGHRGSWVILKDNTTGQELAFVNAHYESELSSKGNTDRVKAAKSVGKTANSISDGGDIPVFMMGDFNSGLWDDPYDALRASKNNNGIYPVEAHTQTTNRLNDKYWTGNSYLKYKSNGSTGAKLREKIIDQVWYNKTSKDDDGTIVNVRTDKTYNDLPTVYHNKKRGAFRTSDHNPQIIYLNLETKKTVEVAE